jgi:hypothetical protein
MKHRDNLAEAEAKAISARATSLCQQESNDNKLQLRHERAERTVGLAELIGLNRQAVNSIVQLCELASLNFASETHDGGRPAKGTHSYHGPSVVVGPVDAAGHVQIITFQYKKNYISIDGYEGMPKGLNYQAFANLSHVTGKDAEYLLKNPARGIGCDPVFEARSFTVHAAQEGVKDQLFLEAFRLTDHARPGPIKAIKKARFMARAEDRINQLFRLINMGELAMEDELLNPVVYQKFIEARSLASIDRP